MHRTHEFWMRFLRNFPRIDKRGWNKVGGYAGGTIIRYLRISDSKYIQKWSEEGQTLKLLRENAHHTK